MRKALLLILLLGGCAGLPDDDADNNSALHNAAISWVGAQADDMIRVWGEPNNLKIDPEEDRKGLLRWRETNRFDSRSSIVSAGAYTCIVEAHYGVSGVITKVETLSTNCDVLYDAETIARLTR